MGHTEGGPAVQLLLAEDDRANRFAAAQYLRRRGYDVAETEDGPGVLDALDRQQVDLLLLDLGLPGLDGLDVLTAVRAGTNVPVIICSARGSETDRIRGLDMGADDYLAKPFSLPELESRIRAVLRRGADPGADTELVAGGLRIDLDQRIVTVDGVPVELTKREFDLLAHLVSHPGHVFSREQLLEEVWGSTGSWQHDSTVTEHVRRIRLKIEVDPDHPRCITTVRGIGYRFERSPEPAGAPADR